MLAITFLAHLAIVSAYIWPDPQLDALESLRFDQGGFNTIGVSGFVQPCDLFAFDGPSSGRSDAADWIRTAYHDMATHNVADGTGGLDASIRLAEEQARPENAGDGFLNTVEVVFIMANRYVSRFTPTEMIGLVACGGVQLTDVLTPLPVKPAVLLHLSWDNLQLSVTVRLFWKDHVGATKNAMLVFAELGSASGGRFTSAWYGVNATDDPFLVLDAVAGVTSLSFVVDGKLEDQGGVGFAIQDGYAFSETSCLISFNETTGLPISGQFDVAVRNGVPLSRLYLEQEVQDSTQRISVVETEISRPAHPVAANSAYSIWSINVTSFDGFTIGAEIDGVKYSTTEQYNLFQLPLCST
ncbi:hypothetical protein K438DRAFT_1987444 [Mycena galopus ATCC 62051]|nr:hypothetical protein K438DRAFT_1987444 [Mycena galopus ATCC 62051]